MNNFNFVQLGFQVGMQFVPFLFALCFHEFAHGMVAKWRGDNTAERLGRLSLNPVAHADMLGTWILPLTAIILGTNLMFGWAKPVPVDSRNLKNPRMDMFWIALAGPASNVLLALVSTVLLAVAMAYGQSGSVGQAFTLLLSNFILINLFLALFNMIPVNPLDGGKVIAPFLPIRWNMWLDHNQGMLSMMLLVFILLVGGILALPVKWLYDNLFGIAMVLAGRIA